MSSLLEPDRLGRYDPILFGTLCNVDAVTLHPEYPWFMTLGMGAFVSPPGDEHKRFVEAQRSTKDKVLALSLFTLFAHENRHFWDYITTSAGVRLATDALKLQHEFITCFDRFWSQEAVYFPFSEWVRDRSKLERISPVLAMLSPEVEAFAGMAEHFLRERQQWDLGGRDPSGGSPSSTQIFEALALIAQGEAIRRYFGNDARALFYDAVRAGETGRWYLGAIDYLRNRLPELDLDGQALLLQMALYGRVDLPARESSPAAVLPYLIEQFEKTRPQFPASFTELFVLCDGYITLLQGVRPALAYRDAGKALFARLNELRGSAAVTEGSALHDLFDCVARTVNLGARFVQKVLFTKNVGNLRITNQLSALYEVPRSAPYFESTYGMLAGAPLTAAVQPIVGAKVAEGWRSAMKDMPDEDLVKLLRQFQGEEPVDLLYIFAPKGADVPEHIKLSWKLFPHMFLCRMAIAGPSATDSLASALLSQFLSGFGKPVYAREGLIAPLEEAAL